MSFPTWVIIETKPSSEEIAERSLRQAGYRVYLPRFRKLLSPHGRDRRPISQLRPLFSRLLFAQDWRGWPEQSIVGTIGLMHLRPSVPATLCDADVEVIMLRERAGEFDEVKAARGSGLVIRSDITPGDTVDIEIFGTRVMGVLDELTAAGKAVVHAMVFGRQVRTEVDADALQKAQA